MFRGGLVGIEERSVAASAVVFGAIGADRGPDWLSSAVGMSRAASERATWFSVRSEDLVAFLSLDVAVVQVARLPELQ
jgi:hypothetical protein